MRCQPRCDVTYIHTVIVVVGIEYYYVDYQKLGLIPPAVLLVLAEENHPYTKSLYYSTQQRLFLLLR